MQMKFSLRSAAATARTRQRQLLPGLPPTRHYNKRKSAATTVKTEPTPTTSQITTVLDGDDVLVLDSEQQQQQPAATIVSVEPTASGKTVVLIDERGMCVERRMEAAEEAEVAEETSTAEGTRKRRRDVGQPEEMGAQQFIDRHGVHWHWLQHVRDPTQMQWVLQFFGLRHVAFNKSGDRQRLACVQSGEPRRCPYRALYLADRQAVYQHGAHNHAPVKPSAAAGRRRSNRGGAMFAAVQYQDGHFDMYTCAKEVEAMATQLGLEFREERGRFVLIQRQQPPPQLVAEPSSPSSTCASPADVVPETPKLERERTASPIKRCFLQLLESFRSINDASQTQTTATDDQEKENDVAAIAADQDREWLIRWLVLADKRSQGIVRCTEYARSRSAGTHAANADGTHASAAEVDGDELHVGAKECWKKFGRLQFLRAVRRKCQCYFSVGLDLVDSTTINRSRSLTVAETDENVNVAIMEEDADQRSENFSPDSDQQ